MHHDHAVSVPLASKHMLHTEVSVYHPIHNYHCKKCSVTERPRGAIFSCFCGNSMGYHGNMKILLPGPWGVPIYHIFYSVESTL